MGLFTMKGKMSRLQRAKQFMPFAALKGFEKEMRVELSEDQLEELNRTIQSLVEGDFVRVLYYTGHCYTELLGVIEAIGRPAHSLSVEGVAIAYKDIKEINLYD